MSQLQNSFKKTSDMRQHKLHKYSSKGHKKVEGWLELLAKRMTISIDRLQKERSITGSVCEIGVHRARFFILLHLLTNREERSLGIDLFGLMDQGLQENYGAFQEQQLLHNLEQHGCEVSRIELFAADSTKLNKDQILGKAGSPARLFSVDGGHDAETALSDLYLCSQCMIDGGVIILDDLFNEQWCGVAEATARFLLDKNHTIVPFLHAGNKLFLTTDRDWADYYRSNLITELSDVSVRDDVFFGSNITLAWLPKPSKRGQIASLMFGEDGLQAIRKARS